MAKINEQVTAVIQTRPKALLFEGPGAVTGREPAGSTADEHRSKRSRRLEREKEAAAADLLKKKNTLPETITPTAIKTKGQQAPAPNVIGEPASGGDSTKKMVFPPDTSQIAVPLKISANKNSRRRDSLHVPAKDSITKPDSSRYFLAFHHVRIFSDSLQSVCDSLFFSARDSAFRLFYDPIIWSGHSQITGDTIYLYTKNKKPARLYAFNKGLIVNRTTQGFYNQITGKTINGMFNNGEIDYMRVKGSQAESIYYAQDNDSAYLGMNRATGDVIDLYFVKQDLQKVLFVNDIAGKFYPMRKIPSDQRYLKNFLWVSDKRPKNRLELFE